MYVNIKHNYIDNVAKTCIIKTMSRTIEQKQKPFGNHNKTKRGGQDHGTRGISKGHYDKSPDVRRDIDADIANAEIRAGLGRHALQRSAEPTDADVRYQTLREEDEKYNMVYADVYYAMQNAADYDDLGDELNNQTILDLKGATQVPTVSSEALTRRVEA